MGAFECSVFNGLGNRTWASPFLVVKRKDANKTLGGKRCLLSNRSEMTAPEFEWKAFSMSNSSIRWLFRQLSYHNSPKYILLLLGVDLQLLTHLVASPRHITVTLLLPPQMNLK